MNFVLKFTLVAKETLKELKKKPYLKKRYNAVVKTLRFLRNNPRHPGLNTHEFTSLKGPKGEKVFVAYAEQNTPAAYRVFFYYGTLKGEITIIAITPHP